MPGSPCGKVCHESAATQLHILLLITGWGKVRSKLSGEEFPSQQFLLKNTLSCQGSLLRKRLGVFIIIREQYFEVVKTLLFLFPFLDSSILQSKSQTQAEDR